MKTGFLCLMLQRGKKGGEKEEKDGMQKHAVVIFAIVF